MTTEEMGSVEPTPDGPVDGDSRWWLLVKHLYAGVVVHAPDSRILLANDAAVHLLGLSLEQLQGKVARDPDWRFVREDGSPMPVDEYPVNRTIATGRPLKDFVLGIDQPTGARRVWVLVNAFPEFDGAARLAQVVVTFVDITDRKQAEDALRESEAKYRALIETSNDVIFCVDKDGNYKFVNHVFAATLGKTAEFFEGKSFWDVYPKEHADQRFAASSKVFETGEPGSVEVTVPLPDRTLYYLAKTNPVRDEQGRVIMNLTHATEITERKEAELALAESEARFEELAEQSRTVVWEVDAQGRYSYVSRAAERVLGYRPDELVGRKHFHDIHSPQQWELFQAAAAKAVTQTESVLGLDHRVEAKDGRLVWISTHGIPTVDADGTLRGYRGSDADITERKRDEEERERLQAQLGQAQKMESIGRLAGGVAHDFNNMLGVILSNVDFAMEQVEPSLPLHDDLVEILEAARRSAELTRQLMAFARRQTVTPKVLNLNATVEGMLKMLRRLLGEAIELVWRPGGEGWKVKVDPGQIDQVLANLCVNGRDSINGVGTITIETATVTRDEAGLIDPPDSFSGEYVLLAVTDSGHGMAPETMAQVFEPFFTTKGPGQGTGLGLATVYGIVRQNDGFIAVESEVGQGTTFRIHLPRHVEAGPLLQTTPPPAAGSGHETILVVEDEPAMLRATKRILSPLGYRVLTADTPGEALRLAEMHAGDIDLLLTDVVMPEMNGRDLAKRLLSLYPNLKRLFMSGYTADVIAPHGVLDDGVHFLQKPFSKDALAARVRAALNDAPPSSGNRSAR